MKTTTKKHTLQEAREVNPEVPELENDDIGTVDTHAGGDEKDVAADAGEVVAESDIDNSGKNEVSTEDAGDIDKIAADAGDKVEEPSPGTQHTTGPAIYIDVAPCNAAAPAPEKDGITEQQLEQAKAAAYEQGKNDAYEQMRQDRVVYYRNLRDAGARAFGKMPDSRPGNQFLASQRQGFWE